MKYFTIKELCKSSTADQYKINNQPDETIVNNLSTLVNTILDPLREAYGKPIIVTSGYRCPELNIKVGGSKTSQHVQGLAADISGGSKAENRKLFQLAQSLDLPFDQLIDEYNFSWIHISYRPKNRKQVLHIR